MPSVSSTLPSSVHLRTVWSPEHTFAPGAQQITFGIEYGDRVLTAIESVHPVPPVDADRSAVTQGDFCRRLRPILVDLEGPFAASELNRHAPLPRLTVAWM